MSYRKLMKIKTTVQSIEPNIADLANGWLKLYKLNYKLEQDNSHGRKISRKIEVFKVRNNERQGFENLRRVIKVERRGSRGDKTYEETASISVA